MTRKTSW